MKTINRGKARANAAFVAALMLGLAIPSLANAAMFGSSSDAAPRGERVLVAQAGQDSAQLMVRIQQLEEQLRQVNGQVEGLTFQITQMQELINRMNEDVEFRFQALEGGAGGKTEAATQSGGVTQPEVLPQGSTRTPIETDVPMTDIPEQGVQPLPGEVEFDPTFDDGSLGESADPLVGTGARGGIDLTTGLPIDLSYDPAGTKTDNPDADAQFAAGYDALVKGDYLFAEDQLSQFLELYPTNERADEAASLLGDALLARSAYSEAAEVLLDAYQKAPDGPRAPDLLTKLGASLAGSGERDTACRTLAEVRNRYANLTPDQTTRLATETAKAECPPA